MPLEALVDIGHPQLQDMPMREHFTHTPPFSLLCVHNIVGEHVTTRVFSASQRSHQYRVCCANLALLWCAVCATY